jgi:hypothetical protein
MFMTSDLSPASAHPTFSRVPAFVERGYPQPDYLTHPSTPAHRSWYPDYLVTHKAVPGQAPGTVPAINPRGVVVADCGQGRELGGRFNHFLSRRS